MTSVTANFSILLFLFFLVFLKKNVCVCQEINSLNDTTVSTTSTVNTINIIDHNDCPKGNENVTCRNVSSKIKAQHAENQDIHVVELHAVKQPEAPKIYNMMTEESEESHFQPTILPAASIDTNQKLNSSPQAKPLIESATSDTPLLTKGRALNFTLTENKNSSSINDHYTNNHNDDDFTDDLSDVTIHDDDNDDDVDFFNHHHNHKDEIISARIVNKKDDKLKSGIDNKSTIATGRLTCEKGGLTYENGEKLEIDCDTICICKNGKMECDDRCTGPFFRKGKKVNDPLCLIKETEDPCCSVMVCAGDTETEPLEMCSYNNKTYNRGDSFEKNCSEVCICEIAGKISCKPRCPETKKTSESCVEIPDPNDACCKKVLCDVTLDDQSDMEKDEQQQQSQKVMKNKHVIISADQLNSSVIILEIEPKIEDHNLPVVEVSNDKQTWQYYQLFPEGKLYVKENYKFIRLENSDEIVDVNHNGESQRVAKDVIKDQSTNNKEHFFSVTSNNNNNNNTNKDKDFNKECFYKGKKYQPNDLYNDDCKLLCECWEGEMVCSELTCPTFFGADVKDSSCVQWQTVPDPFVPKPPNCCPEEIRCTSNGSCLYEGHMYKNWEQIPTNVTGCEKRCYCEMGNVECQNTCAPVPALPPADLGCAAKDANLQHSGDDDCCMHWTCSGGREDSKHPATNNTTNQTIITDTESNDNYLGPLKKFPHEKLPSKTLGPLKVYENDDSANILTIDNDNHRKPILKPDENPFYRVTNKMANLPDLPPLTNSTMINNKTLPHIPHQSIPIPIYPDHQGPHEDIIHIFQEHPELSNLPSGAVVEIQHLPPAIGDNSKQPQFLNINNIPTNPKVSHIIPQDISLEQLLEELHKHVSPHDQNALNPSNPSNNHNDQIVSGSKNTNQTTIQSQDNYNNHYPEEFDYNNPPPQEDIRAYALEAIDPHTVRLAFMVPPIIVGLHGRVEVRYTYKDLDDTNSWELQVFAPPNDLIATPTLEFDLLDLLPDKEYKIKIMITLRDLHNNPSSRIYKIRTPKEQSTTLPPQIPIEPDLEITDINSTWVTVGWRKFTDYELQFIDGVQLRYKEIDGKIYTATPLIHRAVTSFTLENLKANTKYEIGIFFIPFSSQLTELNAEHMLQFTTANEVDTYGFTVTLNVTQIKSTNVEISWNGVPYPEDKYVNIYRAIYQSDTGKEDHSTFKIAKRDSPTKQIITDLKPGTRYRLWLEVYLTNGKIKTSNVQDFITKPRTTVGSLSGSEEKEARAQILDTAQGDYYGPLVVVAVLAAMAILSTVILLLILVRRHNQHKAAITTPNSRINQSAYDNPTYKVEIQQETMGL